MVDVSLVDQLMEIHQEDNVNVRVHSHILVDIHVLHVIKIEYGIHN